MEDVTQIKERLHRKIERTGDVNLLKEIEKKYFPCEDKLTAEQQWIVDNDPRPVLSKEEVLKIVYEREAKYLAGEMKTISADEVAAILKKKYGF